MSKQFTTPILLGSEHSNEPLPIIVSHKWVFTLAYVKTEDTFFYAIQDWIRGRTGEASAAKIWNDIRTYAVQLILREEISLESW